MKHVYASTGGFPTLKASQSVEILTQAGLRAIELSGGLPDQDWLQSISSKTYDHQFLLHNYFPSPEKPFVLNLAALNPENARSSFDHCHQALRLTQQISAKYFSVHAGFLIDINPEELGKPISQRKLQDRERSLQVFIERLHQLSDIATDCDVDILLENNVLTAGNHSSFGVNPLLMVDSNECEIIMKQTPSNVNLLIDVGHLKVSAKTLGFEVKDFLKRCDPWIRAYHLSENDGLTDSNQAFTNQSWFWPLLSPDIEFATVEVYESAERIAELTIMTRRLLRW